MVSCSSGGTTCDSENSARPLEALEDMETPAEISGVSCWKKMCLKYVEFCFLMFTRCLCTYRGISYIHIHVYLSIYLSIYRSIDRSIDLSIYRSIDLSIHRSIDLSIYRSIDLSSYRSIDLSIYRSIDLSIYRSIDLSIYLSIYLSTYPINLSYPFLT